MDIDMVKSRETRNTVRQLIEEKMQEQVFPRNP